MQSLFGGWRIAALVVLSLLLAMGAGCARTSDKQEVARGPSLIVAAQPGFAAVDLIPPAPYVTFADRKTGAVVETNETVTTPWRDVSTVNRQVLKHPLQGGTRPDGKIGTFTMACADCYHGRGSGKPPQRE